MSKENLMKLVVFSGEHYINIESVKILFHSYKLKAKIFKFRYGNVWIVGSQMAALFEETQEVWSCKGNYSTEGEYWKFKD